MCAAGDLQLPLDVPEGGAAVRAGGSSYLLLLLLSAGGRWWTGGAPYLWGTGITLHPAQGLGARPVLTGSSQKLLP